MSIQPLGGGRYRVRVYVSGGKEYRKVIKGKAAAKRHEAEMRASINGAGYNPAGGSVRFGTYFTQTLEARPLAPKTRLLYERTYQNHLAAALGNHRIDRISHNQMQAILSSKTPAVARQIKRLFNIVYRAAERENIILRSPAAGLLLPASAPQPMTLPKWEQINAADPLLRVAAACGLRAGEMMGLATADVNANDLTVTVARQRIYASGYGWHYAPLKTRSAYRTIPVPKAVISLLSALQATSVTLPWRDQPPQTHNIYMTYDFSPWTKHRIGFSAHKLRHLYSDTLVNAGTVPLPVINEALGHSAHDQPLSVRVYSQSNTAGKNKLREVIAHALTL